MNTTVFMRQAKSLLSNKWQDAAIGTLLFLIIQSIIIGFLSLSIAFILIPIVDNLKDYFSLPILIIACFTINAIITGPLFVGYIQFLSNLVNSKNCNYKLILNGFKYYRKNFTLGTFYCFILSTICIIYQLLPQDYTWIIFRIIYSVITIVILLRISIIFFYTQLLTVSTSPSHIVYETWHLTKPIQWQLVSITFRFIGWFIIGILTLGIGFLWIIPYICITYLQLVKQATSIEPKTHVWTFAQIFTIGFIIIFWGTMLIGAYLN